MTEQPIVTHYFGDPVSTSDHLEHVREVVALFDKLGFRVNPTGRLKQFERVCAGAARFWDHDDSRLWNDLPAFIHSLKDVQELHFIAQTVGERADARGKLEFLLGGNLLPGDDRDTQARDYQYELFIASMFVHAGLEVRITDPDIHFKWEGEWYYAEAKRPKNVAKVWKAMRNAAKAIRAARGQGIICVALDDVLFGPRRMLRSPTPEMGPQLTDMHIDKFVSNYQYKVGTSAKDEASFGVLLTLNVPADVVQPSQFAAFRSFRFYNICELDDPRCNVLRGLARTMRPPH